MGSGPTTAVCPSTLLSIQRPVCLMSFNSSTVSGGRLIVRGCMFRPLILWVPHHFQPLSMVFQLRSHGYEPDRGVDSDLSGRVLLLAGLTVGLLVKWSEVLDCYGPALPALLSGHAPCSLIELVEFLKHPGFQDYDVVFVSRSVRRAMSPSTRMT